MSAKDGTSLFGEIDEIPGEDGWWKKSSGKTYREAAAELQLYAVPDDVIVRMLGDLYSAAAEEFGN